MGLEHVAGTALTVEALLNSAQYRHLAVLRLQTPCDAAKVIDQLKMGEA